MTTNIGAQAADAVNEKLLERQKLEQEMLAHHQDLQTLIAQRNENEMVKEVRKIDLLAPQQLGCGLIQLFHLSFIDFYLTFVIFNRRFRCHLSSPTLKMKKTHSIGIGNMRKGIIRRHNLQTSRTSPSEE